MKFTIAQKDLAKNLKGSFIVGITESGALTPAGSLLDKAAGGYFKKLLKQKDLLGKIGDSILLPHVPNTEFEHVLLMGCGSSLTVDEREYRKIMATAIKVLAQSSVSSTLNTLTELQVKSHSSAWNIKQAVEVCSDTLYRFDTYKSKKNPAPALKQMSFYIAEKTQVKAAEAALKQGMSIAAGVDFTKDLANTPSNVCTPAFVAQQAKQLAKDYPSITVKVLEEADMKKLGMGAFLSVAKGSAQDAKLVSLEYKGTTKKTSTVALVGKGVTFDTGGISLKPADSMVGMKYDMCGSATVLGTLKAAAEMKLPLHIVGILALAENMPSGTASKPEDIVTTMSGQTVEILNTDAEGRLVLCDALTYVERFKPDVVIDIATLTGAVVIALGYHATGLLSNNDELAADILAAGLESHDRAWQLPLWEDYQDQLRSPFADMSNVGGRAGGTITAACFLSRYAKTFKWAHLDVAGTAAMMGGTDRYATGRPVPLLAQYLLNRCDKKN